jgi:hypothetical protein
MVKIVQVVFVLFTIFSTVLSADTSFRGPKDEVASNSSLKFCGYEATCRYGYDCCWDFIFSFNFLFIVLVASKEFVFPFQLAVVTELLLLVYAQGLPILNVVQIMLVPPLLVPVLANKHQHVLVTQ